MLPVEPAIPAIPSGYFSQAEADALALVIPSQYVNSNGLDLCQHLREPHG